MEKDSPRPKSEMADVSRDNSERSGNSLEMALTTSIASVSTTKGGLTPLRRPELHFVRAQLETLKSHGSPNQSHPPFDLLTMLRRSSFSRIQKGAASKEGDSSGSPLGTNSGHILSRPTALP